MKKKYQYQYELDNSKTKDFLLSFVNKLIISALSLIIYWSIFYPIYLGNYKGDKTLVDVNRDILLNIGLESKLMHSDDKKEQVYSLNSSYEYYVRTLLRYDYEHSDYDLDTDVDNYKSKQEEMDLFPEITQYNDDFLGYFYVTYAVEKNIVNYGTTTPKDYFKYSVLKINDENSGGKFFKNTTEDIYPHLLPEVRTALFNYVVLGATNSKYSTVDKSFYNFFGMTFEDAGNVLLTYEPYKVAYDIYTQAYEKIYNYNRLSIYISFFSSLLVVAIIVPLFNKNKQNVSQLIFKRADLDSEQKVRPRIYITRMIYDIFRYFPSIFFISFLVSQNVLFDSLFYIWKFPISLFTFVILFTLFNLVSLMCGLIRKDNRNLCSIISNSDNYYVKRVVEEESND